MGLKPVSGKIDSQEINDNFSYLDSKIDKTISQNAVKAGNYLIEYNEQSNALDFKLVK